MFRKTYTKLAALYLVILMSISLFFSAIIFQSAVHEFNRDYERQGVVIRRLPDFRLTEPALDQFFDQRRQQYTEAKTHILNRLVLINLIILVGGGILCYYLARRTLQPIEEAHDALERFTADASHELRTPLAVMQTENEVALMNPKLTLDAAKDQLRSNLEELAKLTVLSEGLLRLARLENNSDDFVDVELEKVIADSLARTTTLAQTKHVQIEATVAPHLKVRGEQASLTEAVVTVLDNAIKYSPKKSKVQVTVRKSQKQALIQIKDQGMGIRASDLPHIFDRFYRADSARSKQDTQGYGLGLAIAKNIVEMHGGAITVKSSQGKGSTFTFHLPLA
ncbi:MAG TPA: ATP-binding protein [Verrucomicrobiae bacterium]|nr:ATP-binding protein [Verrucomicrobiae bacterium]